MNLARRAEHLAKGNDKPKHEQKNALAILLQPRSGAQISIRERWDNSPSPHKIFDQWIKAYRAQLLPKGAGYALREAAIGLEWCKNASLIENETSRILAREREIDGRWKISGPIAEICQRAGKIGLPRLTSELIMARHLARASQFSDQPVSQEQQS